MADMTNARRAAERLTGALSDPNWQPRRHHIESARNELIEAADAIELKQKALKRAQGFIVIDGDPAALITVEGVEPQEVVDLYEEISGALSSGNGTP